MLVIPAIDLKGGACVRLLQGRMEDATVFSEDPVATAGKWFKEGGRRLHIVDLDGAFEGRPVNEGAITSICKEFNEFPIQIGGGIRDLATIEAYLKAGISYAIIGTQAVRDPKFVKEACANFPGQIIVGIDAKNGFVATDGWAETSSVKAVDLASEFVSSGVSSIVYTDIARDGMMQGVNIEQTAAIANQGIPVIASGGVSSIKDVQQLLDANNENIIGAITGRAIYENKLNLGQAQKLCDEVTSGLS